MTRRTARTSPFTVEELYEIALKHKRITDQQGASPSNVVHVTRLDADGYFGHVVRVSPTTLYLRAEWKSHPYLEIRLDRIDRIERGAGV